MCIEGTIEKRLVTTLGFLCGTNCYLLSSNKPIPLTKCKQFFTPRELLIVRTGDGDNKEGGLETVLSAKRQEKALRARAMAPARSEGCRSTRMQP